METRTTQQAQQPPIPTQLPTSPQQAVVPPVPQVPPQLVLLAPMAINWSYFAPEFSGKPEEYPEAHVHRTVDWMDTHNFATDQG